LLKQYGDSKAKMLLLRGASFYDNYCSLPLAEMNHGNKVMLNSLILPGLSIYQALSEELGDLEKVLAEMDTLFRAMFFLGRTRGIRFMN
jgi:hypothetical protein